MGDDVFSFEHLEDKDNYDLSSVVDHADIMRVYTESSYLKLNRKNFQNSLKHEPFRLLWYGRCDDYSEQYGKILDLSEQKNQINEVWKNNPYTKHFVSWNSKIHNLIPQPFSTIKEGNLYFVKINENTTLQIKGLSDTNETDTLGVSRCGHENSSLLMSQLKNEYNLIWYGVCESNLGESTEISEFSDILEVYQFSEKGNYISGRYYANDLAKSTITKFKFGNGYLVRLKQQTKIEIKGCVVSDHVELNTFAPVVPLRLNSCDVNSMETPTPYALCCSGSKQSINIETAKNHYDNNYITVISDSVLGKLCWEEITTTSSVEVFILKLENTNSILKISTNGFVDGKEFRFESKSGICYTVTLKSQGGEFVLREIKNIPQTPTSVQPTPTSELMTPTPTPTSTPCTKSASLVSAVSSSEANTDWITSRAIDTRSDRGWSSARVETGENGDEWIYVNMGEVQTTNKLILTPRILNENVVGFPVNFKIEYKLNEDDNWIVYKNFENYPTPTTNHGEEFDIKVNAQYIRIHGTKFTTDGREGRFYMQIMEIELLVLCANETPTPKPNTICCESDVGIIITKEMSDKTNPSGPAGITISGFEEGAILCLDDLTQIYNPVSYLVKTDDNKTSGLITLSFKPVSGDIKYKCLNGICYTGTLKDATDEPQILTRD